MQWHQLDHMQTICTLLQTDNHTNTKFKFEFNLNSNPEESLTVKTNTKHGEGELIVVQQLNNSRYTQFASHWPVFYSKNYPHSPRNTVPTH